MKNKKLSITLIIALVGMILAIGCMNDAILIMKGKTIDLNTAEIGDFYDSAIVEGNIYYPVDYFATYEEKQTYYGVPVSKKETYYYLVANVDRDWFEDASDEREPFYVVFSTADEDMIKKLNNAIDKWDDFMSSDDYIDFPDINIEFEGKLANQPAQDDYEKYRDEFLDIVDISQTEVAMLRIADGKVGAINVVGFFGGIVVLIGGIVGIIWAIVSERRPKNDDEVDFY